MPGCLSARQRPRSVPKLEGQTLAGRVEEGALMVRLNTIYLARVSPKYLLFSQMNSPISSPGASVQTM